MNRSVNLSTKYQPYREVSTSAQCVNLTANCQPQHKAATISARSVHLSVKYQSQREVSTSIQAAISAWSTNLSRKQQSQYDTSTLTRSTNLTAKCQPQHTVSASVQSINLSTKYNSVWIHCVEIATSCWDLYFTLRLLLCIEVNTSHWDWWWGWYFVVRLTLRGEVDTSTKHYFHSDKFVNLHIAIPPPNSPPSFLLFLRSWSGYPILIAPSSEFWVLSLRQIRSLICRHTSSSSLPSIDDGYLNRPQFSRTFTRQIPTPVHLRIVIHPPIIPPSFLLLLPSFNWLWRFSY